MWWPQHSDDEVVGIAQCLKDEYLKVPDTYSYLGNCKRPVSLSRNNISSILNLVDLLGPKPCFWSLDTAKVDAVTVEMGSFDLSYAFAFSAVFPDNHYKSGDAENQTEENCLKIMAAWDDGKRPNHHVIIQAPMYGYV